MVTFPDFPTELITRPLSFLSPKDLATCTRLSKRFFNIIQTSPLLTYTLELGKASLEKPEFFNCAHFENSDESPSDILDALRKRELGLSKFVWTERWDIPVVKRYNFWDVCGSVFVGGVVSRQEDGVGNHRFDAMDVYDFANVQSQREPITTLLFDKLYDDCAMDPGQDLLILVDKVALISSYYKLHFRCLSTGHQYEHVELNHYGISIPIPDDAQTERPSYRSIGLEICGDVLLFRQTNNLTVVNWKTGHTLTLNPELNHGSFTCRLISETEFLTAGRRGTIPVLEYHTLQHDYKASASDSSLKLRNCVELSLPFRDNYDSSHEQIEWKPILVSSEALYTPKPFSPFVKYSRFLYPSRAQLVHIHFYDATPTPSCVVQARYCPREVIDMFVHIGRLRESKDRYSLSFPAPSYMQPPPVPIVIPWNVWGPDTMRVFEHEYTGWGKRSIRGYRALIMAKGVYEATIFDFNPKEGTSSDSSIPDVIQGQSVVVTDDGVKIISSLPYRKTPLRCSLIHPMDRPKLIGDDIIYIGQDHREDPALSVFHF